MDGALATDSPTRRLRALTRIRQKWKDRVAAKHRQIRALRVKVRDLQASRDAWKRRASAAEDANAKVASSGEASPSQP
jgi:predicted  nucleic acid-binding Zn-ribbon protein